MRIFKWAAIRHYRTCPNFLPEGWSNQVLKNETYFLSSLLDKIAQTVVQPSLSLLEHQLQLSSPFVANIVTANIFTSNNQKTRVDSNINSGYNTCSPDRLYLWCTKLHTAILLDTRVEILKCTHSRPQPWWRWLQLHPSCSFPQWDFQQW